jgi:hypothetical protein|tara:strand:+ start:7212 stop:7442 length:231 start_codon:yes stop_codon:yes gene_type:complete
MAPVYKTITFRISESIVPEIDWYQKNGIVSSRNAAIGMLIKVGLAKLEPEKDELASAAKAFEDAKLEIASRIMPSS